MYNYEHCDKDQEIILKSTPYFFLTKEEQVNFHFMMHMRLQLKSPDFMESFERELLDRKYKQLESNYPGFGEIDCQKSFIKMKEVDFSNVDHNEFQKIINDPNSPPIVAKGFLKDTNAVKNWTHQYLIKHYNDTEIMGIGYGGTEEETLKKLKLSEILHSQLDKESKVSYYINNSAEIFNDYPELIDEIGADRIIDLFKGHSANSFSQIFVGNLKTWGSHWHQGNDISCALMINGVKRWYFVDPRLGYILQPFLNGANGMSTKADVRHDIAFHKIHNPLYAYAPKLYVDIEPGDVIFFTKYWPHAVVNLSPLQIMVTMRMTEVDLDTMKKGYEVPTLMPVYDNILNSDPTFIKFKFDIFKNLGKKEKKIGDQNYFSCYNTTDEALAQENQK